MSAPTTVLGRLKATRKMRNRIWGTTAQFAPPGQPVQSVQSAQAAATSSIAVYQPLPAPLPIIGLNPTAPPFQPRAARPSVPAPTGALNPAAPSFQPQVTAYPLSPSQESPFFDPLMEGLHEVAEKALEEYGRFSQIRNAKFNHLWKEYVLMLATTERPLLRVIVHGNLQLSKMTSRTLQNNLRYLEDREPNQPGIYMLELVDEFTNEAPSPAQLEQIIAWADDYVSLKDPATALLIDKYVKNRNATYADMLNGKRAYMKDQIGHPPQYKKFRNALKKLWRGFSPAQMDMPMRQPLREVGYSKVVASRLKQHYKHTDSNYLMGLFDAICHVQQAQLGQKFTIVDKGQLIFLMWRDLQPMQAETLFTALAQADTTSGRGFCHADPGDTATTHYTEARFKWHIIQQDVLVTSCFRKNAMREVDRINAREALKQEVQVYRRKKDMLDGLAKDLGQGKGGGVVSTSDPSGDDVETMAEVLIEVLVGLKCLVDLRGVLKDELGI